MAFIDEYRDRFGVEPVCRALQIAPSTYWAYNKRRQQPAARSLSDERLLVEIRRVHDESRDK